MRAALFVLLLALPGAAHAMPAVAVAVAASAAGSAVAGAFFAAGTLGFGLVSGGVGLLVSAAGNALFGQSAPAADPQGAGSFQSEARGRTQVVRSAVEPRRRVYGQTMVSGPLVYAETTGASNEYLHLVIPLASHSIASVDAVYLNDELLGTRDSAGDVTDGTYYVQRTVAAVSSGTVGGGLTGTLGATPSAIQSLVILPPDASTSQPMTQVSGAPASLMEFSVSGVTITFHADAVGLPWTANYTYLTGTSHVRVKAHLGATDQAADADLVAASAGKWTASHRLQGVAYVYVRLLWNADLFPGGVPNVKCLVSGNDAIYDPRDASTGYSNNWALVVRDYLTAAAADGGMAASDDEVDDTAFIAAANVCDEAVSLVSGSQVRYTADGTIDTSRAPLEILKSLMTGAAGVLTYSNSAFGVYPAAWATPTVTLTVDDLRGALRVTTRMPRRELFNAVRGTYASPDNFWQPADFPVVLNATYATQDGGDVIYRDIELPFTTDATRAQRLAKIALEKARQGITVTAPCKLTVLPLAMWDTVQVTDADLGWSAKTFRVAGWKLAQDGLGVDLVLREDTSASYDWAYGEATTVDAAPDTNLPTASTGPAAPGTPAVSEELYVTRDGAGVRVRVTVSWSVSAGPFAVGYELEWKGAEDAAFRREATSDTSRVIEDVAPGVYLFRVRTVNTLGQRGGYSDTEVVSVVGLGARPAAPTSLTLQKLGGLAVLGWPQSGELDVLRGGRVLFRHSEATTGATWETSVSIGDALGVQGDQVLALLPLKSGTYLAKFQDSSGLQSESAASVVSDGATVLTFSTLGSVTEDSTFPGTKSSVVVDGTTLKLVGAGLFDDITDFDTISSLDDLGGVVASGTYTFSAGVDLSTKKRCRVVGTVVAATVNTNDLFDDRTGLVDDWLDFDGAAGGGSGDCYLEVRSTDDNPAGTPTWSAWNRLDASEYYARAFQFRAQLISNDPAYNEYVTQLRAAVSEVV